MARVELDWDLGPLNPGPLIDVTIGNSRELTESGIKAGLEYPKPLRVKACLDTGASITVINRVLAQTCKLFLTSPRSEISSIGAAVHGWEHAAAITFPGTKLTPLDPVKVVSTVFVMERFYAVLIGRDILRNWLVSFDGPSKKITISEKT